MEEKTKKAIWIAVFCIMSFAAGIGVYYNYTTYHLQECRLWVVDGSGSGLSVKTNYCTQLKTTCISETHNLSCEWIGEGNEGCRCQA